MKIMIVVPFSTHARIGNSEKLRWCPDVIHCHGWMTALAPLYIKKAYKDEPSFRDAKVVFSVYEDDFKNTLSDDFAAKLMLKGISKKI